MIINCLICKKDFKAFPSAQRKYCSTKCDGLSRITAQQRNCLACKKSFFVRLSQIKLGRGKYCSHLCEGVIQNKKVSKICLVCKKAFLARPTDLKNGYGKFCSHRCSNQSTKIGGNISCHICLESVYRMPSHLKRKGLKYCSKACVNKAFKTGMPLSEEHKIKMRLGNAKFAASKQPTSIEKIVYNYLLLKGILFEKQKLINGKFLVDAYIPSLNLVIEADGCYWHSCEKCVDKNKMDNRQRYAKTKDLVITQKLANEGYIVLRFWEHEIHTDINSCISKIKEMFIHGYSI